MFAPSQPDASAPATRVAIDLATLGHMVGEHLPVAAAATLGDAHVLRWVSAAFCRLLGASADDLIGRPFVAVLPAAVSDGAAELLDRVLRTGRQGCVPETEPGRPAQRSLRREPTAWPRCSAATDILTAYSYGWTIPPSC